MIHQLICEGQTDGLAVVVTTLRTVKEAASPRLGVRLPVSTATTAYYVVSEGMARRLAGTDVFFSGDDDRDQISTILQDRIPDILRRRTQTGRLRVQTPPGETEADLQAVFGKHGGPMPVYQFTCDQARGGVEGSGDGQVMRGTWTGRGLRPAAQPAPSLDACGAECELDMAVPSQDDVPPETCMVFDEPEGGRLPQAASGVRDALCAAFPEICGRLCAQAMERTGVPGQAGLTVVVRGGVPSGLKLKIMSFLAEYGCSDPEESFSKDGDWICSFDFRPDAPGAALCEGASDPATVVLRVPGEADRECWLGGSRRMQDLSTFDGGAVRRAFAVRSRARALDARAAAKAVKESQEIVADGGYFSVKSARASGGRIIVEARRRVRPGQAVCDFPSDLVQRLDGPCGLPRRDEELYRRWTSESLGLSPAKPVPHEVLGGEFWCDEPAFGCPRECVKVLLRLDGPQEARGPAL